MNPPFVAKPLFPDETTDLEQTADDLVMVREAEPYGDAANPGQEGS